MSFKGLKYSSSGKIKFVLFTSLWQGDFKLEKLMSFSEIFNRNSRLDCY